jgi:hypothetical protein
VSRRHLLVAAIAIATVGVMYWATAALGQEAKLRACAVSPDTAVQASFSIGHASDIDAHFPFADKFLEFQGVDDPAFIVVFSGPVTLPGMHPAALPGEIAITTDTYDKVVCILVGDRPAFYYNVNTTGFAP